MGAWLNGVLSSEGAQSSSRLITLMVAVIGGMLIAYDTFLNNTLRFDLFGTFLTFGATIYGVKTMKEAGDAKKAAESTGDKK